MPFQYSQVVAFTCVTADITFLSASSFSTKPNPVVSTDNSLFSSGNDSDSVESKENGTPTASKQVPTGAGVGVGGGGGGLFDDEDEDDDFFSGKSLKKSDSGKFVRMGSLHYNPSSGGILSPQTSGFFPPSFSAAQEKPKPKKALDLFDEDDEDGDIFSEKYSAPAQSKKEVVDEQVKQPEKKVKLNIHV